MKEFSYLKLATIIILIATTIFGISCLVQSNHGVDTDNNATDIIYGNFSLFAGQSNYFLKFPAPTVPAGYRQGLWYAWDSLDYSNGYFTGFIDFKDGYFTYNVPLTYSFQNHELYLCTVDENGTKHVYANYTVTSIPAHLNNGTPIIFTDNITVVAGQSDYVFSIPAPLLDPGWYQGLGYVIDGEGNPINNIVDFENGSFNLPIPVNWTFENHTLQLYQLTNMGMVDFLFGNYSLISVPAVPEPVPTPSLDPTPVPKPDVNNSTNNNTNGSIVDAAINDGFPDSALAAAGSSLGDTGIPAVFFGALACIMSILIMKRE